MFRCIIFLVFLPTIIYCQNFVTDSRNPEAEFHSAINPRDTNNIILVTMNNFNPSYQEESTQLSVYYTLDFGSTWMLSEFTGSFFSDRAIGDPVVGFDADGNAYLTAFDVDKGAEGSEQLTVFKSNDGGNGWREVFRYGYDVDKPWMAIDTFQNSLYKGNKYYVLINTESVISFKTEFIATSNDTITNEIELPVGDFVPTVALRNDGDIFCTNTYWGSESNDIYIHHISDGGNALLSSHLIVSLPNTIMNAPQISNRFQQCAYMSIDNSTGEYVGRIYLAYTSSEVDSDNHFDVYLTYSDDEGGSWSTPAPISNSSNDQRNQFYSSIYVSEDGKLLIDWYEESANNSPSETSYKFAISEDGGVTFTEQIANIVTIAYDEIINVSGGFGIGDYHQSVMTNHTAFLFWNNIDSVTGELKIYYTKVDLSDFSSSINEINGVNEGLLIDLMYPNPLQSQQLYFVMRSNRKRNIDIRIDSNDGRLVNKKNIELISGRNDGLLIDLQSLSSGLYIVTFLENGQLLGSRKIIVK